MKLNEIIQEMAESKDDFYARSYWCDKIVIVWQDSKRKGEGEVWDLERARRYVKTLPERIAYAGGGK